MSKKLDFSVEAPPGDGQPEAARPAFEATPLAPPPPEPEPSRPAPAPVPEAPPAPGERVLSHAEHVLLIVAGKAGPALARGERRAEWPAHLRDEPKPPEPEPTGARELNWAQHMALQDQQRAERAARRAERCAARGRPAPQTGAFA